MRASPQEEFYICFCQTTKEHHWSRTMLLLLFIDSGVANHITKLSNIYPSKAHAQNLSDYLPCPLGKSVIFPQHKADIFLFHCFSDSPLGVPVLRGGQDPYSNSSPKILSLVLNYHFCFTVPSSFLAPRDFTKSFFTVYLEFAFVCNTRVYRLPWLFSLTDMGIPFYIKTIFFLSPEIP